MSQHYFIDLYDELIKRILLRDRPESTVNEQLALFLILGHKDGIKLAQDLFVIACEVEDLFVIACELFNQCFLWVTTTMDIDDDDSEDRY